MIEIIENLDNLKKYKNYIDKLYSKYGKCPYQSYIFLKTNFITKNNGDFKVFIDSKNELLSAFETYWYENTWKCSIESYPILGKETDNIAFFLKEIAQYLKPQTIYFPKVYIHTKLYNNFINIKDGKITKWDRLPVPIINCSYSKENIYKQEIERYGKRILRQKKKFEKNLYVKEIKNEPFEEIIKDIEINSWKRQCNQDMLSRENQFTFYTNIIKLGGAQLFVAFEKETDIPVSYRIDAITKDKVYFLKSSFKEQYKKYSPGSYLIATDLIERYVENKNYSYIDLCGSRNILKNMVATDELKRVDICYIYNDIVEKIKEERTNFSKMNKENYLKGNSIRKIYMEE